MARRKEDFYAVAKRVKPEEVEEALGKTERMNILLTPRQKAEIRAAADRYGLSMTDYLMRLHELVEAKARERRGR